MDKEKADRLAFVEEYLELCRKYGIVLNVNSYQEERLVGWDRVIDLELDSIDYYDFETHSNYLKGLV